MNGNNSEIYPPSQGFRRFCQMRGLYFEPLMTSVFEIIARSMMGGSATQRPFRGVTALLLRGPAGTGKTEITKAFAEYINAEYIFYQCYPGSNEDDLLYNLIPDDTATSGIRLLPGKLVQAVITSREQKTVLVLDEFDKTRPQTDAFLLDFLQNCRITVNIHGELKELEGNPENLVVILTSNDERDFSEPLLRRVISVYFRHLPPNLVARVLREHGFDDEIVTLLTQLYIDTINAGLQKPATIQELLQLSWAIRELGENADWATLVHQFVVKYDDDWERFKDYIRNRNIQQTLQQTTEDDSVVVEAYEQEIPEEPEVQEPQEKKPRMPKLSLRKEHKVTVQPNEDSKITEDIGAILPTNEDNYDLVIRKTLPEPAEEPVFLGKFKVNRDFIVHKGDIDFTPWFIAKHGDYKVFLDTIETEFRGYINAVFNIKDFVRELSSEYRIKYYTKTLTRIVYKDSDTTVDIVLLPNEKRIQFYLRNNSNWKTVDRILFPDFAVPVVRSLIDFRDVLAEVAKPEIQKLQRLLEKYRGQEVEKELAEKLREERNRIYDNIIQAMAKKLLEILKTNENTLIRLGRTVLMYSDGKIYKFFYKNDGEYKAFHFGYEYDIITSFDTLYISWSNRIDRETRQIKVDDVLGEVKKLCQG
ncbi:MAG: MoxR family ATPase [Candidatus Marinimicrobia bacterium]|nr:MoxR family ATPase [Candidatus Neomarinimicrobiota bacterium]